MLKPGQPVPELSVPTVSVSHNKWEPERFREPSIFLVRPDNTLFAAMLSSFPFGRPPVAEVLSALLFARRTDYPARGDVADL